ncbi:MAG: PAS domain S-box protein [Caldimonas sp.]
MIPEHLRAAHWRGFEAAMQSGTLRLNGRATLTRGLHKSGRKLYIEMSFALVRDGGVMLGSVAVARDVTERVEQGNSPFGRAGHFRSGPIAFDLDQYEIPRCSASLI